MNNNPYQGQYQAPQYTQPGQPYPNMQDAYAYTTPQRAQTPTKSGFLTFCFAFVPGAGEMYLGHMKRGVSLSALFFGLWWLSAMLIDGLWIALPVIWMYCFFDTFNLRSRLAADNADPDAFIFHLDDCAAVQSLLKKRHKVLGWVLIFLGGWAIYDQFISPAIWQVCSYWNIPFIADFFNSIPSLLLIIVLILVGVWLVRGPQQAMPGFVASPEDDIEYYAAAPQAEDPAQAAAPVQAAATVQAPQPEQAQPTAPEQPEAKQDDTQQ